VLWYFRIILRVGFFSFLFFHFSFLYVSWEEGLLSSSLLTLGKRFIPLPLRIGRGSGICFNTGESEETRITLRNLLKLHANVKVNWQVLGALRITEAPESINTLRSVVSWQIAARAYQRVGGEQLCFIKVHFKQLDSGICKYKTFNTHSPILVKSSLTQLEIMAILNFAFANFSK
jgi:hypothetical protein